MSGSCGCARARILYIVFPDEFFGLVYRYSRVRRYISNRIKPGIKKQSRDAILATAAFSNGDKKNGDSRAVVWAT